jgi:hypothetical protein
MNVQWRLQLTIRLEIEPYRCARSILAIVRYRSALASRKFPLGLLPERLAAQWEGRRQPRNPVGGGEASLRAGDGQRPSLLEPFADRNGDAMDDNGGENKEVVDGNEDVTKGSASAIIGEDLEGDLGVEDGADAWQDVSLTRTTSVPERETHQ